MIFKTLLTIAYNHLRRGLWVKKRRTLVTIFGLLFLPTLIYLQTIRLFRVWNHMSDIGPDFMLHMISLSFLGLFALLFLSGLSGLLHHLFTAPDLSLLLTLPLSHEIVFAKKLIEANLYNMGLFVAVGLPLLISMAVALQASAFTFVVIVIGAFLFLPIPTALSAFFALIFARLGSVRKTRRWTGLVFGLFIIVVWASVQLFRISRLDPLSDQFEPEILARFQTDTPLVTLDILPTDWLVHGIYQACQGEYPGMGFRFILLAATSVICLRLVLKWRVGLLNKGIEWADIRPKPKAMATIVPLPGASRLVGRLFLKDLRLTFRDTRLFQSAVILLVMIIIIPFVTDVGKSTETIYFYLPYIPVFVLSVIVSAALSRSNVPMERLSFQFVRLAPLSLGTWLGIKLIRPVLLTGSAATLGAAITAVKDGTPLSVEIKIIGLLWLLICGAAGLGQTIGARAGNFNWSDPRYMVNIGWTYASTLFQVVYGAVGLAILAAGLYFEQQSIAFLLFFVYVCAVLISNLIIAQRYLETFDWLY